MSTPGYYTKMAEAHRKHAEVYRLLLEAEHELPREQRSLQSIIQHHKFVQTYTNLATDYDRLAATQEIKPS